MSNNSKDTNKLADAFEKWWRQVKKDKSCKQAEDKVAAIFISGWRACEMAVRDGGKGDTPRPLGVSMEEFDRNFDAIFNAAEKKKEKEKQLKIEIEAERGEASVMVSKDWEI